MRRSKFAEVGLTALFVGNLYEAVVDVPRLLVDAGPQRRPGLFTAGSPLRFYAAIAPLAIGATASSVVAIARRGDVRRAAAAGSGLATTMAATAYVVGTVNLELLTPDHTPEPDDARAAARHRRMLRRWYVGNAVRLGATAATAALLAREAR